MEEPFVIIEPKGPKVPFILSVPHCGTAFPDELKHAFIAEKMGQPDDTDWFVHELYNFASELGITIIHARYSRWVIDLNRDPESKPLYNDGRIITALTTTTDFFGNPIYVNESFHPDQTEVERRLETYYWPYINKIQELLDARKEEFGKALLWDAHSIRHFVPTIRKEIFPDMILGTNDGRSADHKYIDIALAELRQSTKQVNYNDPFKGGFITRNFGKPENGIHALQLEMNKILYMDNEELNFHEERANAIRVYLRNTFEQLIHALRS